MIVGPRGVMAMYGNDSGRICEVLDGVRTRLYPNAVIPVALAHSSAALPLGVGQSVLRALAQKGVGLPENTQIRSRPAYR